MQEKKREEQECKKQKHVVFETRIPPKQLASKCASHLAFREADNENAEWRVCHYEDRRKEIVKGYFPSRDNTSQADRLFSDGYANIYRDHCIYGGTEENGYKRDKRNRLIDCNGLCFDFDSHNPEDMPLDEIRNILLSDGFEKAVPYASVVFTGHGYQVHIDCTGVFTKLFNAPRKAIDRVEAIIAGAHEYLGREFGLTADPACKDINHNFRLPGSWNTKDMRDENNLTARIRVKTVKTQTPELQRLQEWLNERYVTHSATASKTAETIKKRTVEWNAGDDEILKALAVIPPEKLDYSTWYRIGMALHSWDADKGFATWDEWSQQDSRYDGGEMPGKWASFCTSEIPPAYVQTVAVKYGYRPKTKDGRTIVIVGGRLTDTAKDLGKAMADAGKYYRRGGTLAAYERQDGKAGIYPVSANRARSEFEAVASIYRQTDKGELKTAVISKTDAEAVTEAKAFAEQIPVIDIVSPVAVLTEDGNAHDGYVPEKRVYALRDAPPEMNLPEAKTLLFGVLTDFDFVTEADGSRALAGMFSPALVFSGLLDGRAPIDLTEADASQSGKGYRNKLTAAIYGERVHAINQTGKRGVGSLDEALDTRIVQGHAMISIDNVRGKIDSPKMETMLTEDSYFARCPYSAGIGIDPRRYVIQMTSNQAEVTRDLANRSSIVNIRKRPSDYKYRQYPEGDILSHIRANQEHYLGAVFAVVRKWLKAGKPTCQTAVNTAFGKWWGVMDYICGDILGVELPSKNIGEVHRRISDPTLAFLRQVCIHAEKQEQLNRPLLTAKLLAVVETADLELPVKFKYDFDADFDKLCQALGRMLGKIFRQSDSLELDGYLIERGTTEDSDRGREAKTYRISKAGGPMGATDPPEEGATGNIADAEFSAAIGSVAAPESLEQPELFPLLPEVTGVAEQEDIFAGLQ